MPPHGVNERAGCGKQANDRPPLQLPAHCALAVSKGLLLSRPTTHWLRSLKAFRHALLLQLSTMNLKKTGVKKPAMKEKIPKATETKQVLKKRDANAVMKTATKTTKSLWGQAVERAKKKEKDPVEMRKLAKRLYTEAKQVLKKRAAIAAMKPATKTTKSLWGQAVEIAKKKEKDPVEMGKLAKRLYTEAKQVFKKRAANAAVKPATKTPTKSLWGQAKEIAKKKEKDPVEMVKLAKRLYHAMSK